MFGTGMHCHSLKLTRLQVPPRRPVLWAPHSHLGMSINLYLMPLTKFAIRLWRVSSVSISLKPFFDLDMSLVLDVMNVDIEIVLGLFM